MSDEDEDWGVPLGTWTDPYRLGPTLPPLVEICPPGQSAARMRPGPAWAPDVSDRPHP